MIRYVNSWGQSKTWVSLIVYLRFTTVVKQITLHALFFMQNIKNWIETISVPDKIRLHRRQTSPHAFRDNILLWIMIHSTKHFPQKNAFSSYLRVFHSSWLIHNAVSNIYEENLHVCVLKIFRRASINSTECDIYIFYGWAQTIF